MDIQCVYNFLRDHDKLRIGCIDKRYHWNISYDKLYKCIWKNENIIGMNWMYKNINLKPEMHPKYQIIKMITNKKYKLLQWYIDQNVIMNTNIRTAIRKIIKKKKYLDDNDFYKFLLDNEIISDNEQLIFYINK